MKCQSCLKEHDGSYGSGRFCSAKCARGFSTKAKRQEINKQVSKKLTAHDWARTDEQKAAWAARLHRPSVRQKRIESLRRYHAQKPFEQWGKQRQRRFMLDQIGWKCAECGYDRKDEKGDGPFQIHHKDGNRKNWAPENLKPLCYNCHWFTENWGHKGRKHTQAAKDKISRAMLNVQSTKEGDHQM